MIIEQGFILPLIILINENSLNDLKDAQGIYLILGIQGVGGG